MEGLLLVLLLIIVFALGPVLAMLDVLSREVLREDAPGIHVSRLAKAVAVCLVPLAWIPYFLLFRRRLPFS